MQPGNRKCGAKTRKGSPCADIAMANGRCKRHGGKSTGAKNPPKGEASAVYTHGIYTKFYRPEEKQLIDEGALRLGQVDDELNFMRIRLKRTIEAREAWESSLRPTDDNPKPGETGGEDNPHMALVEHVDDQSVTKDGDVIDTVKQIKRLPDFDKIEQACLGRIESLEKTRKELLKEGDGGGEDATNAGKKIIIEGGLPQ